jgi:hypothetical protein
MNDDMNNPVADGNREPGTFDQEGRALDPTPPKIDLRDAHAIRRELGSVYRDARAGRIQTQDATKFAYILDLLRRAYETAVMQDRLELLERTFSGRKKR